jgi:hypothetical protein
MILHRQCALVQVEGWPGYWTVEAVRPKPAGAPPAAQASGLVGKPASRRCEPTACRAAAIRSAEPAPQACPE